MSNTNPIPSIHNFLSSHLKTNPTHLSILLLLFLSGTTAIGSFKLYNYLKSRLYKPTTTTETTTNNSGSSRRGNSFRKSKKSSSSSPDLSSNSQLISHLQSLMESEFTECMRFIFEKTDRGKYARDLQLKEEDLELVKEYADCAMPIRCNATISTPNVHVTCLNAVDGVISEGRDQLEVISCLDIGSGSGFVSSALCHMLEFYKKKGTVLGIDHLTELVEFGQENVERDENSKHFLEENSPIRLIFKTGNGYDGKSIQSLYYESFEPSRDIANSFEEPIFDIIHMGAASPSIPQHLYKLLKPNGRIVCPVGPSGGIQELFVIEKHQKVKKESSESDTSNSQFIQLIQSIAKVHFVPLFGSVEEQERHYNRSNPRIVNVDGKDQFLVLPYLHLVDNSITSMDDIKWEGE